MSTIRISKPTTLSGKREEYLIRSATSIIRRWHEIQNLPPEIVEEYIKQLTRALEELRGITVFTIASERGIEYYLSLVKPTTYHLILPPSANLLYIKDLGTGKNVPPASIKVSRYHSKRIEFKGTSEVGDVVVFKWHITITIEGRLFIMTTPQRIYEYFKANKLYVPDDIPRHLQRYLKKKYHAEGSFYILSTHYVILRLLNTLHDLNIPAIAVGKNALRVPVVLEVPRTPSIIAYKDWELLDDIEKEIVKMALGVEDVERRWNNMKYEDRVDALLKIWRRVPAKYLVASKIILPLIIEKIIANTLYPGATVSYGLWVFRTFEAGVEDSIGVPKEILTEMKRQLIRYRSRREVGVANAVRMIATLYPGISLVQLSEIFRYINSPMRPESIHSYITRFNTVPRGFRLRELSSPYSLLYNVGARKARGGVIVAYRVPTIRFNKLAKLRWHELTDAERELIGRFISEHRELIPEIIRDRSIPEIWGMLSTSRKERLIAYLVKSLTVPPEKIEVKEKPPEKRPPLPPRRPDTLLRDFELARYGTTSVSEYFEKLGVKTLGDFVSYIGQLYREYVEAGMIRHATTTVESMIGMLFLASIRNKSVVAWFMYELLKWLYYPDYKKRIFPNGSIERPEAFFQTPSKPATFEEKELWTPPKKHVRQTLLIDFLRK